MKTFLFTLFSFAIATNGFSQTAALPDSTLIKTKIHTEQNIGISCGATLNNYKNPLFIVDGVLMSSDSSFLSELDPKNILEVKILKEPFSFGCFGGVYENGVVLISTKKRGQTELLDKEYAFKIHEICNTNWTTLQDVYNAIQGKVPNVQISTNFSLSNTPNIKMRGDDNTIVIVDGVRYDASILNALNPADIESVSVALSAAATNYFINN